MTQYDWQYNTLPQPYLIQNGTQGVQMVPRGKTIGGTSAMNWMIHNTDSSFELDIWETLLNNTGWNWNTISTAFRESETFYAPPASLAANEPYIAANHGGTGPICSTFQRSVMSLLTDYLDPTLTALGYPFLPDRNGGNVTGAGLLPLAVCPSNYTRSYSGSAYTAVQARTNLVVHANSQVTRIVWQNTTGNVTAAGLEFVSTGTNITQQVRGREVVLSGGIIGSPQILQLSGVGDPKIMNPLGIETVVNLPSVGVGLRDPPMTNYMPLSFVVNVSFTGTEWNQNFIQLEPASSILAPEDYAAASAWLNSTTSIPGLQDIQFEIFKQLWFTDQPLIEIAFQYASQNFTPYNLYPLSQGTVQINSSDPLAPPAINPNYNSVNATINGTVVQWDLWFLAKAAQHYVSQIATTPPMSTIIVASEPPFDVPFETYQESIFRQTGSSQHLTGGNSMAPAHVGGVVDPQLLVYGTTNVRIVDGSVFPFQPSAHPMGLTYALAVRAARIFQSLPGGGGLTHTELPASNVSSNATAVFPSSPTVSMFTGAAAPTSPGQPSSGLLAVLGFIASLLVYLM